MGADLFESYVGSLVSALTLGVAVSAISGVVFPLAIAGCGLVASIIGTFFVKGDEKVSPQKALKMGSNIAALLVVIVSLVLSKVLFGNFDGAIAVIAGLIVGVLIGLITECYTSADYNPVKKIGEQSETGPATTNHQWNRSRNAVNSNPADPDLHRYFCSISGRRIVRNCSGSSGNAFYSWNYSCGGCIWSDRR